MSEILRNRNRTRSWSDISDIIDEEMNTPMCRVAQGLIACVMLTIAIYIGLRLT